MQTVSLEQSLRCPEQKSVKRISHTSSLLRDDCLNDSSDVGVRDDVITLTSLSDSIAQTQQVTHMPGIRFGNTIDLKTIFTAIHI